jgi:flavin-binding protein dodecin
MEHTYKHIELTGSSAEGSDQAVQNAIAKASQTVKNLHWFQVIDTRGYIEEGGVKYWQVTIKVGFRIED